MNMATQTHLAKKVFHTFLIRVQSSLNGWVMLWELDEFAKFSHNELGRLKMGWHQFWGSIPLQGKSLLKNDLSWILSKVFSYSFLLIFVALFSKIAYLVYHAHLCFLMSPMTIMNTIAWPFYWWERFGWLARRLHTISRSGLEKWFILILVQFLEIFFWNSFLLLQSRVI